MKWCTHSNRHGTAHSAHIQVVLPTFNDLNHLSWLLIAVAVTVSFFSIFSYCFAFFRSLRWHFEQKSRSNHLFKSRSGLRQCSVLNKYDQPNRFTRNVSWSSSCSPWKLLMRIEKRSFFSTPDSSLLKRTTGKEKQIIEIHFLLMTT